MQVPFYQHNLDSSYAHNYIAPVLDTPFLTTGKVCKAVEEKITNFFGVSYCKMTNSWTNGAIATLLALNIKPGDEVIVPAMTFIASANVVEILGAKPVFVDVDPDTLLLNIEAVKNAVTDRTKAIIPVHLYGLMLDIQALRQAVGKDIFIIEDCAHCFEGDYKGSRPGTYSDAAIFSFYATKNLSCGEGGAIITASEELYKKITQTVLHGMSAGASDRFKSGSYNHWDMTCLGTKANLPDILAALLPPQIDDVLINLEKREQIAQKYKSALNSSPVRTQHILDGARSAHHLFPIHVPPTQRDSIINILNTKGISVTVNYNPVPEYTYYKKKYQHTKEDFPVAYEWGLGTISLPMFPKLPEEHVNYIIEVLEENIFPIIKTT